MSLSVVYAGTPEFAVPALEALVGAGYRIPVVLTQPDRPAGRGRQLQASPVKRRALELGLAVLQPETLKNEAIVAELSKFGADLFVVAAYGLLLPPTILALPRLGCLNLHASLLPRWRGAAPVQRALIAGDAATGVAIMHMEAGLDTGPVYAMRESPIGSRDTGASLTGRLADVAAALLVDTLPAIASGHVRAQPQPVTGVVYANKLTKAEARLDWSQSAAELDRRIRAYVPWPVAETSVAGVVLKVHEACPVDGDGGAAPGTICAIGAEGIDVATGAGRLRMVRVQLAGRGVVSAAEFARNAARTGSLIGTCLGGAP